MRAAAVAQQRDGRLGRGRWVEVVRSPDLGAAVSKAQDSQMGRG